MPHISEPPGGKCRTPIPARLFRLRHRRIVNADPRLRRNPQRTYPFHICRKMTQRDGGTVAHPPLALGHTFAASRAFEPLPARALIAKLLPGHQQHGEAVDPGLGGHITPDP